MLIKDGQLDVIQFKSFFDELKWVSKKRKTAQNKKPEVFYLGVYENAEKKISISVRPTLWMRVTESQKNMTPSGEKPSENYKGPLVDYGTSVEVKIDQSIIDQILKVSKERERSKPQTVSW